MVVHSLDSDQRIQIGPKRKIAFVCSGGATKAGAFHLGVALALQEQGFKFLGGINPVAGQSAASKPMEISTYVGSSAGSIISAYLAAGYSIDNIINSFLGRKPSEAETFGTIQRALPRLTYQKMFKIKASLAKEQLSQFTKFRHVMTGLVEGNWESLMGLKWLKLNGLFSPLGIEQYLREEVLLSNQFQNYLADLFIVATELNHPRKVVFGKQQLSPPPHDPNCEYVNNVGIADACAASTSLPLIFAPHAIKNEKNEMIHYIDGEIRETLSTHVAIDNGADLVIASYTHQPYQRTETSGSLTEFGLPAIAIQSIYLLIEQKIKNHIHNKQVQRNAIESVSKYCSDQGLSEFHRKKICEIMEKELHHRMEVDSIYIHPQPTDSQLFFGEHFSLSPKKMTEIVKSGFRAAISALKKYEFADRVSQPAIGTAGTNHS